MRRKIRFSKCSRLDLEAIVEYYHPLSPKTARRYYHGILGAVKKLIPFPELGRIVPEFEEEFYDQYREILFESYQIIYRSVPEGILIVRIVDGRRLLTFDFVLRVD